MRKAVPSSRTKTDLKLRVHEICVKNDQNIRIHFYHTQSFPVNSGHESYKQNRQQYKSANKVYYQPRYNRIITIFTLLVCSNKSSIAAATSGTAWETSSFSFVILSPVAFMLQMGSLKCISEEGRSFWSSSSKSLALLLHTLDCLGSSLKWSFLLTIHWLAVFLRSCDWLGKQEGPSPDTIRTACVGNWLVVHNPASWSWMVTSLGRNESTATTSFCQTVQKVIKHIMLSPVPTASPPHTKNKKAHTHQHYNTNFTIAMGLLPNLQRYLPSSSERIVWLPTCIKAWICTRTHKACSYTSKHK